MAFKSFILKPGLNTEITASTNEAGWAAANLIRFPPSSSGQPEVIGGWKLQNSTPLTGTARGIVSWSTLPGSIAANTVTPLAAIGTSSKLYVWNYAIQNDVTPAGYVTLDASWFLSPFGELLMAVRRQAGTTAGSPLYNWQPAAVYGPATVVANGPTAANGVVVNSTSQQVIVWGAPIATGAGTWGAVQQPMQVSWSDYSNPTTWFAAPGNAAGSFPLTQGSQIMTIIPSQGQMLVFTDSALYSMQFQGGSLVYGFQQLGANCGLVSPRAVAVIGGVAVWWSNNGQFFVYDGVVRPIPCPVRNLCLDIVFPSQPRALTISASSNSRQGEVRFDFPAFSAGDVTGYVSYNLINSTWGYGVFESAVVIARTCMTDYVPTIGSPIGVDQNGHIWLQETGSTVDETVSGGGKAPLPWSITSGYFDVADGEEFVFIDSIYPDAVVSGSGINLTVSAQSYSQGPTTTLGPFECGDGVTEIPCRMRGRQIALLIENNTNQNAWRLGKFRLRVATDGRR